jgi:dTDP-4-amino-4,6-dideoxygalactose transaminase
MTVVPFLNFEPAHLSIRSEMLQAFEEVYDGYWYIMGEKLKTFEKSYAVFNQVKYAVGVSNGLDALHLCLKSLGIGKGDEVIIPSNTYIATVLAVSYVGATPVFVEPDPQTYNIDPNNLEQAITSKTKAIMPVHLFGQACAMDKIMDIAKKHGLWIVEDNAQAHGATFNGKLTGSFGIVNATSFYPGKNLGALGDAGTVTTDDDILFQNIMKLRNYGSTLKYNHEVIGFNMRLDEIQAAFLEVKLKHLNNWTKQRQEIASWYDNGLKGIGDLISPVILEGSSHVYHLYVIRTEMRDNLQNHLNNKGIGTLIHYPTPPHLQSAYEHLGFKKGDFPIAEKLSNTSLSIPIWPGMKKELVYKVVSEIRSFFI